jgi:uncharacterized membrane protein
MLVLIAGIVLFLGVHLFTTLRGARAAAIARLGPGGFKGVYSLLALVGFGLICWGFHLYRAVGWVQLWAPPAWGRPAAIVLMWFAFVALAASGGPPDKRRPSRIGGWLRHPMLVGVKIWALAHLLANGDLGGLILFASFLAWAVYDRISVKRRGDAGIPRETGFTRADAIAVAAGSVVYTAMLFLHPYLIGVAVLD